MKKSTIILIILIASVPIFAQNYTQTIRGKVTESKYPHHAARCQYHYYGYWPINGWNYWLPGKFHYWKRTCWKTHYPGNLHRVRRCFLYNEIEIITGSQLILNVALTEDVATLKEVVVIAKDKMGEPINSMVTISAQRVTVQNQLHELLQASTTHRVWYNPLPVYPLKMTRTMNLW